MGVFSIIETFIFFSLAISFILILLLVYHFKARMAKLEQKTDTMVGIINDIAKELANIHQKTAHPLQGPPQASNQDPSIQMPSMGIPPVPFPLSFMMNMVGPDSFMGESQPTPNDKVEEIDQEDDDDDDDDDDDETDDEDDDDDDEPNPIQVKEDEQQAPIDLVVEPIEIPLESSNLQDIDENQQPQPEDSLPTQEEGETSKSATEKDYRKMGIQTLRQEVVANHLAREKDANKMKKNELLHLLGVSP